MNTPEYGTKVRYTKKPRRVTRNRQGNQPAERIWVMDDYPGEGLFLGVRNLSNGKVRYDLDGVPGYMPVTYFLAAFVSPSETQNPIYVPLDDIQVVE